MKRRTTRNYPIHAGGHLWTVAAVTLTELPDGTQALSAAELSRIHRAVANAICGAPDIMGFPEFEFLCDITLTTFTQVAEFLDIDKSTVTTWRKKGLVPSRITSNALKRWFWFRLFGSELAAQRLPISRFQDDEAFLQSASQRAIRSKATMAVALKRAS